MNSFMICEMLRGAFRGKLAEVELSTRGWGWRGWASAVYNGATALSVVIHALLVTGSLLSTHVSSSLPETYRIFPVEGFNVSFMLD